MIFRKYGALQARLILEKQDQIRILEEELLDADLEDVTRGSLSSGRFANRRLYTRQRNDEGEAKARCELMQRLETTIKEYTSLLTAFQQLNSFQKPQKYELQGVLDFVQNTKPLVKRETEWLTHLDDLITLRASQGRARLTAYVELLLNRAKQSRVLLKSGKPSFDSSQEGIQMWLTENTASAGSAQFLINVTSSMALLILTPVMFVVPIYLLSVEGSSFGTNIGILVAFTIAFTLILLIGTPAELYNCLSSSAA